MDLIELGERVEEEPGCGAFHPARLIRSENGRYPEQMVRRTLKNARLYEARMHRDDLENLWWRGERQVPWFAQAG